MTNWDAELRSRSKAGDEPAIYGLIADAKGRFPPNAQNLGVMIEQHPDLKGLVRLDDFQKIPMVTRPWPGWKGATADFEPQPLRDSHIVAITRWFNRNGYLQATAAVVGAAILTVAEENAFDPLRDYLEGLRWDGIERIGTWLPDFCGAESTDFNREVGMRWMLSAVARATMPGCKADAVLVMEGTQGAGKSSALRCLASPPWFGDALPDLHSKDASSFLRGRWIIEIPEMSAVNRSEVEQMKAFISRSEERYRPAYGRVEILEPRRCVFAATTNRGDYLRDETGSRRFWPVAVGKIDVKRLEYNRNQMWAEAMECLRQGANWWLPKDVEQDAARVQADRRPDDPWTDSVLRCCDGETEIACKSILAAIGLDPERMGRADSLRVAAILTAQGWRRQGQFTSGDRKGLAKFVAPPVDRAGNWFSGR